MFSARAADRSDGDGGRVLKSSAARLRWKEAVHEWKSLSVFNMFVIDIIESAWRFVRSGRAAVIKIEASSFHRAIRFPAQYRVVRKDIVE